ncbi:MAG: DUF1858 domain-containing protein [Planctomycetes bacterium]|nr:DUF1858 domain-containing protein [Planctomycetota bacterium]
MICENDVDERLDLETMIPDFLGRYPQARVVFDRYGLNGCGGRLGPVESIGFFARTHGVDQQRLLAELHDAVMHDVMVDEAPPPEPVAGDGQSTVADTIYRRFFTAGIAIVLTAGATWGAWLLWRIGIQGAFTSISLFQVNAHGHAQIFGWVGLFIMGFAYQAFPRMWHTPLAAPRWAAASFAMMLTGLCVQVTGMTLAGAWSHALPAAVAGNILQIAAVAIFAAQLAVTFARSGKPFEPYVAFALAAVAWFAAMTVFTLWHTYQTMAATSREQLLYYVSTYQAPLRDMQVHGLALFMILGVSIRMLPALFDLPAISRRRAWAGLAMLTAAVAGEIVLFIIYRWTHQHAWTGVMWLSWVLLAVGVGVIVWPWRLWRRLPTAEAQFDRSAKFIRAAYAWLAVSLAMLLLLPVHQVISGIAFSHAYYGAIRHAITVGFISLMIMGIAAKVVPTLNGIDTRTLPRLWVPFALVNLGCFLRVSTQTLTDWNPTFFAVIGISGTLEVTGLAWWGMGLVRIMRRGKRESAAAAGPGSGPRPSTIEPSHRVADVLAWFPATEPVFIEFGFTAIRHAIFRRTLARQVTLAQACRMHSIAIDEFLPALNAAAGGFVPLRVEGRG